MMDDHPPIENSKSGLGNIEFIIIVAALTSVVAFSIDIMLPALSTIGRDFEISNPNDQQYVLIAFAAAFGASQIIFGPLTDSMGRKPVLFFGLAVFVISSFAAAFITSFYWLIFWRAMAGIGASAVRITTNAIVRDCHSGRAMAKVMSFVFTVFMIIPVVAPSIGQLIISFAHWHWLFIMLGVFGLILTAYAALKLNETLSPDNKRPLGFSRIILAFREILTNRIAFGYTLAVTLFFGALFSFVISIAQIIEVTFNRADWFAGVFAFVASFMAIGSFSNGRFVDTFGMRRLSHAAVIFFVILGTILYLISLMISPPLWLAIPIIALIMGSFGLVAGNFQSIAMQPLGHIAGSASSVLGMISFTGGAILGGLTGQMFDGTIMPLALAYCGYGTLSLTIVLITERGKLFGNDDLS